MSRRKKAPTPEEIAAKWNTIADALLDEYAGLDDRGIMARWSSYSSFGTILTSLILRVRALKAENAKLRLELNALDRQFGRGFVNDS